MAKEYLTEENYERGKKKIRLIALAILVAGLLIGGGLIGTGVATKNSGGKDTVSEEEINDELATLKAQQHAEFKANGLSEEYYKIGNKIQSLENKLSDSKFSATRNEAKATPLFMFGGFAIFASLMLSAAIYMRTKGREIVAFHAQQIRPVAKEGIEKATPTIAKAGATIAKEMGPAYGAVAKEVAKGIKEGLKDEEKKEKKK